MNGLIKWLPTIEAPRDGTVIYGFFYQGKPSELRADIRPIKWSGWGGGVWSCAVSGHHLSDGPAMFTRTLPYPDQKELKDALQAVFDKQSMRCFNVTRVEDIPEGMRTGPGPIEY